MKIFRAHAFVVVMGFLSNFSAQAQVQTLPDDVLLKASPTGGSETIKVGEGELPPPELPKSKEYTEKEMKAACSKYEGKYVAYYDRIFKVEKCKRRELIIADGVEPSEVLKGKTIVSVESDTIAKIPEGLHYGERVATKPDCNKIEGRYLLSRGDDVFYVENCKKRLFPDWDTYTDHSRKRGKRHQEILELSDAEFAKVPDGKAFESSLDAEYKKLLVEDSAVDIVPLTEACKGINGKYLSYYSKIYKIDQCKKRSVDPTVFVRKFPSYKLVEMSSEQWVSLPDGKDLKL